MTKHKPLIALAATALSLTLSLSLSLWLAGPAHAAQADTKTALPQVPEQMAPARDAARANGVGQVIAQYDYPTGRGRYAEGTIVRGTDQLLYQCRAYPNSGRCNQASASYAPGSGPAWTEAWTLLQ